MTGGLSPEAARSAGGRGRVPKASPAERSLQARAAGLHRALKAESPAAVSAPARKKFLDRFVEQVRADHPDLPDTEVARRAGLARRAYMADLSRKSAAARRRRNTPKNQ